MDFSILVLKNNSSVIVPTKVGAASQKYDRTFMGKSFQPHSPIKNPDVQTICPRIPEDKVLLTAISNQV